MSNKCHNQWNLIATVMIDSGKYFNLETCTYTNELSVIQLCQKDPLVREYISKWLSKLNQPRERTLQLTNGFRTKGNEYFDEITGQNDLAADYYTQAIFSAPNNSVELALAHANRAACSVTSDRFYEEGYFDCKLALQFNYPNDKLNKLFERKQYLANQTNKNEEYSAETYLEMKSLRIELDEERNAWLEEYQSKVSSIYGHDGNMNRLSNSRRDDNMQQNVKFHNKSLIEKSEPSVGRYLVTAEAIKENEVIYTEKAFSFVPIYSDDLADNISYSCQNCGENNCLPFPCYICARASYCSPLCLAEHQPIHKYECVGFQKNLWTKLGFGYLALRTFIVGFKDAVKMIDTKKSTVEEVWSNLMSDDRKEFPYGNVLRLISHVDKINKRNLFRFALTAQMMTIYLSEYTEFFSDLRDVCGQVMSNVEDWKTLAAALMLRHIGQAYFTGHLPTELQLMTPIQYNKSYGYGSNSIHLDDLHLVLSSTRIFWGFFPKLNMMNHSCDPNIRTSVDGSKLSVYADRDIGENEEVFASYGPHYKLVPKDERQTQLKMDFCFECKCQRCVSNDTTIDKYYEYYCPNDECRSLVDLKGVDSRWWYYEDYTNRTDKDFTCNECGTRLSVNPSMMQKFEKTAQGHIDKGYTYYSTDDYVITTSLMDLYFDASKCLGAYHELKSRLAHLVLGFRILESKQDIFPRLAYITMENFVNRLERYGQYTLEFILVATHALSILRMAKTIERTNTKPEMARDIVKIRKILDIAVIRKSLTILPRSLRMIFENIVRDVEFDGNGVNQLGVGPTNVSDRYHLSRSFAVACGFNNSEKSVG